MAKLDKLITYAYLREEVDIPQSIPDDELEHSIYRAQEILRMVLCNEFYADFLAQYKDNTLDEAYTTLFPYIKKFLAWQAYSFWTVKANFKPTRAGFRIHTEENSVIASAQDMAAIIKDSKYQAEFYKNDLIGFIKGNSETYPLNCNECGKGSTGNSFHISAVKNKGRRVEPYGTSGGCNKW